jgi:hypothetical protein
LQAIVFFGIYSFGDDFWTTTDILASLDHLEELVLPLKTSSFSEVKAPSDWTDITVPGGTIFELLEGASGNDQQVYGETLRKVFENLLRGVHDNGINFADAVSKLQIKSISVADNEYYLALKSTTDWPDIEGALNVSNPAELYQSALTCLRDAPVSEADYFERCEKVFSRLIFDPNVGETLKRHGQANADAKYSPARVQGICGFSHSVTDALNALNGVELQGKNTRQILDEVRKQSGFECSPQGKDKGDLRFKYNDGTKEKELNCEFHIKIHKDNDAAATYFQDRIYFGFCGSEDEKKIFVAHSGQHL